MNRRSFITKALAGLAAIPILGKLVNSQHVEFPKGDTNWRPATHAQITEPRLWHLGPIDRVLSLTIAGRYVFNLGDRVNINQERYEVVSVCNVEHQTILELKPVYDPFVSSASS